MSDYLVKEGLQHGGIGQDPAWFVAPYVSVWAIQSLRAPGQVGWWAVCGDHPNDYISSSGVDTPREVLRAVGEKWFDVSSHMLQGVAHPTITIGTPDRWPELGDLLRRRAKIFTEWSSDESLWNSEER